MEGAKIDQRHAEVKRLVDEFHADGVIYENMKFCEFWSYEKVLASHILTEEMGVPCCTIEKEYALAPSASSVPVSRPSSRAWKSRKSILEQEGNENYELPCYKIY